MTIRHGIYKIYTHNTDGKTMSWHISPACSALGLRRFRWSWRLCCLTWLLHARLDGGRSLFVGDLGHSVWRQSCRPDVVGLGEYPVPPADSAVQKEDWTVPAASAGNHDLSSLRHASSFRAVPVLSPRLSKKVVDVDPWPTPLECFNGADWCGLRRRLKVRLLKSAFHCWSVGEGRVGD